MSKRSSPKKMYFTSKTSAAMPKKVFPEENLNKALNLLIYGMPISKLMKKSSKFFHHCNFYIFEDDCDYLQWLSHLKPYSRTRIDLKTVKNITDEPNFDSKLSKKFQKFKKISKILFITHGEDDVLILKFKNQELKQLFWQGLQHMAHKAIEKEACFGDVRRLMAQKLFIKADKDGSKTLDFEEIKKILQKLHIEINHEFLVRFFEKYDKDKNREIDWDEFQAIIDDISLKPELLPVFQEYCKAAKFLDGDNVMAAQMDYSEFQEFLRKEQKQELTQTEFRKMLYLINSDHSSDFFQDIEKDAEEFGENAELSLNFSEFCSIIFSRNNHFFDPEKQEIYQNMKRPLTEYYINTSHNTYLLANQLTSESSTKAYVNALAKGCRCLEIDCWEGDKGEPIIYHGYTFTSKILFRDVIQTIKDYAFIYSPYPVILSFENHCKEAQQDKMAEILVKILGDCMYILPENYQDYEKLPSPEDLKYKILIKDKSWLTHKRGNVRVSMQNNESFEKKNTEDLDDEEEKYLSSKDSNLKTIISRDLSATQLTPIFSTKEKTSIVQPSLCSINNFSSRIINPKDFVVKTQPNVNNSKQKDSSPKNSFDVLSSGHHRTQFLEGSSPSHRTANFNDIAPFQKAAKQTSFLESLQNSSNQKISKENESSNDNSESPKKPNRSPALRKLLALYGIKMNLLQPRSIWHISSIKEQVFGKLAREHENVLQDFLRVYLLRIYPSGTRVDSSNYDPTEAFCFGVQMIALNVQTLDLPMLIYLSKFQENGGINCGYVLKPEFLLVDKPKYLKEFSKICKIVCVEVISGQQLRPENEEDIRDVVDPYVEVMLKGTFFDEKENHKVFKSNVVNNNGFNPKFHLLCQFKICCPDLAFIVFKVFDQEIAMKDMKIGWNAIPLNCLRPGYRTVPLLNSSFNTIEFSCLLCKIEIKEVVME